MFAFTLFSLFMVCPGSPSCGDRIMALISIPFIFGLVFLWSPGCGDRTMVLFYILLFALTALFLGFGYRVSCMVVLRLLGFVLARSGDYFHLLVGRSRGRYLCTTVVVQDGPKIILRHEAFYYEKFCQNTVWDT